MRALLPFVCLFWGILLEARKCVDKVDNVLSLDQISQESAFLKFFNVKITTYDEHRKPSCDLKYGKPMLRFPGFVGVIEGEIELKKGFKTGDLKLLLTAEHDSGFIGQVCEKGKSKNFFIGDEVCSLNLCDYAKEACKLLSTPQRISATKLFKNQIPLSELDYPQIEGRWKSEVILQTDNTQLAHIRLEKRDYWLSVSVEDDMDHGEL